MLKVNDIFVSIDGEINQWHQGVVSTFLRLSGCNLKCSYCDTDHSSFQEFTPKEVYFRIKAEGHKKVTITGGEPLMQKDLRRLIFYLTENGFKISIETNGTIKIPIDILYLANWIMDIKLPSSGCTKHILDMQYYRNLPPNVYFKFCIADVIDYETANNFAMDFRNRNTVAFSPIIGGNKNWPTILAEKMINDRLPYIYNLQIHKYLNIK